MIDQDTERLIEFIFLSMRMYEQGARRSGRTTRMIDATRDGDVIVCLKAERAEQIRRHLARSRKLVIVLTCDVRFSGLERVRETTGEFHFDHEWVWEWFALAIKDAHSDLASFVKSRKGRRLTDIPPSFIPE